MPEQDLESILERMGIEKPKPTAPPKFVMPENRFLVAKKKLKRPGIRKFIKPENALCVRAHLPKPDAETHCLLKGNFVLGDMIPHILANQHCQHLRIASLGLSPHNAESLAHLVEGRIVDHITVLCSTTSGR